HRSVASNGGQRLPGGIAQKVFELDQVLGAGKRGEKERKRISDLSPGHDSRRADQRESPAAMRKRDDSLSRAADLEIENGDVWNPAFRSHMRPTGSGVRALPKADVRADVQRCW